MGRKRDDAAIGAFFNELASQTWLGRQRRIWPQFFFHVTDVQNAASILAAGRLLCRTRLLSERSMVSDNASGEILDRTPSWLFDFVRLYFRPRTPTFYRNEGIRPFGYRQLDAHCPMPIALLFDAKAVAGESGVRFSDGNLASATASLGEDVEFLRLLDFQEIYHAGPMAPEATGRITARRGAEIIVPGELALDALRYVVARSPAERQTLLTLLQARTDLAVADPQNLPCRLRAILR